MKDRVSNRYEETKTLPGILEAEAYNFMGLCAGQIYDQGRLQSSHEILVGTTPGSELRLDPTRHPPSEVLVRWCGRCWVAENHSNHVVYLNARELAPGESCEFSLPVELALDGGPPVRLFVVRQEPEHVQ